MASLVIASIVRGNATLVDDGPTVGEIRLPVDVAYRALALVSVIGLAFGADRVAITNWLTEHQLWRKLAPSEAAFIDTPVPSRQQIANASWLSERLVVLLWALEAVNELPPPDEQCDTSIFLEVLPPFAPIAVSEFVASARLRQPSELTAMADDLLSLHWEARDARIKGRAANPNVNLEIIQERHHAINWLTGYEGLEWDEVTTDT